MRSDRRASALAGAVRTTISVALQPFLERSDLSFECAQVRIVGDSAIEDASQSVQIGLHRLEQQGGGCGIAPCEPSLDLGDASLQRDHRWPKYGRAGGAAAGVCAPPRYLGFAIGAGELSGELRGRAAAPGLRAARSALARR